MFFRNFFNEVFLEKWFWKYILLNKCEASERFKYLVLVGQNSWSLRPIFGFASWSASTDVFIDYNLAQNESSVIIFPSSDYRQHALFYIFEVHLCLRLLFIQTKTFETNATLSSEGSVKMINTNNINYKSQYSIPDIETLTLMLI